MQCSCPLHPPNTCPTSRFPTRPSCTSTRAWVLPRHPTGGASAALPVARLLLATRLWSGHTPLRCNTDSRAGCGSAQRDAAVGSAYGAVAATSRAQWPGRGSRSVCVSRYTAPSRHNQGGVMTREQWRWLPGHHIKASPAPQEVVAATAVYRPQEESETCSASSAPQPPHRRFCLSALMNECMNGGQDRQSDCLSPSLETCLTFAATTRSPSIPLRLRPL